MSIGTYKLLPGNYVYVTAATGESQGIHCATWCELAADAIKFVRLGSMTLPHVRNYEGSWSTNLYTTSNGGTAYYTIKYYGASGTYLGSGTAYISAHGSELSSPFLNLRTVVVDATHDIAIVGEVFYNGQPSAYNGIGIGNSNGSASLGWERAGSTIYAPMVKHSWYDRWSNIYITNVGTQSTTATVTYYNQNGTSYSGGIYSLAVNQQRVLSPAGYTPAPGFYSAKIVSNNGQPLAAIVWEADGNSPTTRPAAYNAYSASSTTLFAPLVKRNYYDHSTGIVLQNTSASQANVTVQFCNDAGTCQSNINFTIPGMAPYLVLSQIPDGFIGSARFTSNQPLTGQSNESNFDGGRRMIVSLALLGTNDLAIPVWYDRYLINGSDWRSGVTIQNAGTASTAVNAKWYDYSGALIHTENVTLVNSKDSHTFFDNTSNNIRGTMYIHSTSQPIIGVANVRNFAGSGDTTMATNASNR